MDVEVACPGSWSEVGARLTVSGKVCGPGSQTGFEIIIHHSLAVLKGTFIWALWACPRLRVVGGDGHVLLAVFRGVCCPPLRRVSGHPCLRSGPAVQQLNPATASITQFPRVRRLGVAELGTSGSAFSRRPSCELPLCGRWVSWCFSASTVCEADAHSEPVAGVCMSVGSASLENTGRSGVKSSNCGRSQPGAA